MTEFFAVAWPESVACSSGPCELDRAVGLQRQELRHVHHREIVGPEGQSRARAGSGSPAGPARSRAARRSRPGPRAYRPRSNRRRASRGRWRARSERRGSAACARPSWISMVPPSRGASQVPCTVTSDMRVPRIWRAFRVNASKTARFMLSASIRMASSPGIWRDPRSDGTRPGRAAAPHSLSMSDWPVRQKLRLLSSRLRR